MKRFTPGVLLLALALSAHAATTLNLKDADINTLISTVSEVTGKNFIVHDQVKGKVTVISSRPMSAEGVYETFLAVLAVKGYAAVQVGEVIKIVLQNDARTDGGSKLLPPEGLPDDDIVTQVFQIQNVSAAQLVPILKPLGATWGHLAAYGPSNMLIVSDRASNMVRLKKLIEQIDQTGDREIELVKLTNAGAADMVRVLTTLTQQDKQADPSVKPATMIADERTNSILIGGDKSERQKLLDIISQLDVPMGEDGATQVVYLRYASAENLAPILEGYAQQADAAAASGGAPKAGGQAPAASGGAAGEKSRIIADKDTNALVITAAPKTMRAIRNVVAQLDIKRHQVLVEAVIAEVSASKSSQLGIDWAVFNADRIAAAGILDPSTLAAAATAVATGNPAAMGAAVEVGLNVAGGRLSSHGGTSFAVLLKALQGDGDTNVLSTPSILATDNEESEISVGQEVPFLTGSYANTGTTGATNNNLVNPFQTIQRKDVGLKLGLTPQISGEGQSVQMKINLEISSLAGSATGAADLITNKRTVTTTVTVEDGQILVLGGLIDDNVQDSQQGIPFLSSIPILGTLFQTRNIQKQKRNLMVFIRPAIVRQEAQGDYYTRKKYDSVRDAQIDAQRRSKPTPLNRDQPLLRSYDDYKGDFLRIDVPRPAEPERTREDMLQPVEPAQPAPLAPMAPPSEDGPQTQPQPAPPSEPAREDGLTQ